MKLNLDEKDIKILNKLLEISKRILTIYDNLYNMEINNKIIKEEYNKQLDYLSICLEIEDKLYKEVDLDKIYDYIEYSDRGNLFKNFSDYDLLVNDFTDLLFAKRVYNRLDNIASCKIVETYQTSTIIKNDYPPFDHAKFLVDSIHEDILNTLIFLINNSLNDSINYKYKNDLIKTKYLISFLNSKIEYSLKNSFHIDDKIYLNSKTLADLFDIDNNSYNRLLSKYFKRYIKIHISNLANIGDFDYQDDFQKVRSIILETIIKAYLEVDNDNSCNIDKLIHDIINMNIKNNISIEILKNILNNRHHEKVKILRSERLVFNEISK